MIVRAVLLYEYDKDFCMILLCGILYDSMMVWASVWRTMWTSLRICGLDFCMIVSEKLSFLNKSIQWGAVSSHTTTHERTEDERILSYRLHYVQWDTEKSFTCNITVANDRKPYKMPKIAQQTPPLNTSKQIIKHFFFDDPVHARLPQLSSLPPGAANLSLCALKSLPSGESRVLTYSSLLCRSHGSPDWVSDSVLPSKTSTLHNDVTQTILTVLPWILKRSISRYRKLPKLHHCTL